MQPSTAHHHKPVTVTRKRLVTVVIYLLILLPTAITIPSTITRLIKEIRQPETGQWPVGQETGLVNQGWEDILNILILGR